MCIIMLSEVGDLPNKDKLKVAYDNNPHGFGVMWVEDGRVQTEHGLYTFEQVWETLERLEGTPWCMHLRWVTRGKLSVNQCHPFQISSKALSGRDIWMMHNGTFMFLNEKVAAFGGLKSDTECFADGLREILRGHLQPAKVLFSDQIQRNMKRKIEPFNKMVFLTDEGHFKIFNQEAGEWLNNSMWVSNTYSFQVGYRMFSGATVRVSSTAPNAKVWAPISNYKKGKKKKKGGKSNKDKLNKLLSEQEQKAPNMKGSVVKRVRTANGGYTISDSEDFYIPMHSFKDWQ